jgi:hypothetical protein
MAMKGDPTARRCEHEPSKALSHGVVSGTANGTANGEIVAMWSAESLAREWKLGGSASGRIIFRSGRYAEFSFSFR